MNILHQNYTSALLQDPEYSNYRMALSGEGRCESTIPSTQSHSGPQPSDLLQGFLRSKCRLRKAVRREASKGV